MPISESVNLSKFYPKSNYKIAKYLDLTKFVSLLQQNSLFFCRLDKLEDRFEGTYTKPSIEIRDKYNENLHELISKAKKKSYEEDKELSNKHLEWDQKSKSLMCVCCWNKYEKESIALWKIYSDFKKGIMITTSIEKLKESFKQTDENIDLIEIEYIDFNKKYIPLSDFRHPACYKHLAYTFEEEVRLLHTVNWEGGLNYDWSKEKIEEGKNLNANIKELIGEIIISPHSPNWYYELVQGIVKKYGLDIEIKKSKFTYIE